MTQTRTNTLHYVNQKLHWGGSHDLSAWSELAAKAPVFLYNLKEIESRYLQMKSAWDAVSSKNNIYYAMKANSHPEILKKFKDLKSGIDVVSAGEINRAMSCGFTGKDLVFSGVGKSREEIELAIKIPVYQINVESIPELLRIAEIANRLEKEIDVAIRVNPDIDIATHPYIATGLGENKFGLEFSVWPQLREILLKNPRLRLVGLSLHLGSQMLEFSGFQDALKLTKKFFKDLRKEFALLKRLDVGGGLGIFYEAHDFAEEEKILDKYVKTSQNELQDLLAEKDFEIQTEPGRWIVAHAGVMLTEIQYVKETAKKNFLVVNAGMTHLIRPALYEAYHQIFPLMENPQAQDKIYDVVGPICESSDFLAKNRKLKTCQQNDILCVADVGAYGVSMASDYNLQVKPIEICL